MPVYLDDIHKTLIPSPVDDRRAIDPGQTPNDDPSMSLLDEAKAFAYGEIQGNSLSNYAYKLTENLRGNSDYVVSPGVRALNTPASPIDPTFNPEEEYTKLIGTQYESFLPEFRNLNSQSEFAFTKVWVDNQLRAQQAMAKAPIAATVGGFLGGAVDPLNALSLPLLSERAAMLGSKTLSSGLAHGASIATTATGFGALNALQTKFSMDAAGFKPTTQDMLYSVAAGVILGGITGHANYTGALSATQGEIESLLRTGSDVAGRVKWNVNDEGVLTPDSRSVGAAHFSPDEMRRLDSFTSGLLKVGTLSRHLRGETFNTLLSPLSIVRDMGDKIFGSNLRLTGSPDDFVTLYSKTLQEQGQVNNFLQYFKKEYTDYLSNGQPLGKVNKVFSDNYAKSVNKLQAEDFKAEITLTNARRRVDPTYKSDIAHVNRIVDRMKAETEARFQELKANKLLDENQYIPYYQARKWKLDDIKRMTPARVKAISEAQYARTPGRFIDAEDAYAQLTDMFDQIRNGKPLTSEDALQEFLENGEGTLKGSTYVPKSQAGGQSSFLQSKNVNWDDDILSQHGIIETDAAALHAWYMRKTRDILEMRRFLDRHQVKSVTGLLDKIRAEKSSILSDLQGLAKEEAKPEGLKGYFNKLKTENASSLDTLIQKSRGSDTASPTKIITPEKLKQIDDLMEADIKSAENLIKEHFGTIREHTPLSPYVSLLKKYTSTIRLGRVVISSLSDVMMAPLRIGFSTTFNEGLKPLISQIGKMDFSNFKNVHEDLNNMGQALELMMNDGLQMLIDGETARGSFASSNAAKMADKTVATFMNVSGMNYWNSTNRTWIGGAIASKMSKTLRQWSKGTLDEATIQRFKDLGINENNVKDILEQIDKHGASDGSFTMINWKDWDKGLAKDKMSQALQQEIDSIILNPNAGDIPSMFLKSDWGALAGQFQSFNSAASTRIFVAHSQDRRVAHMLTTALGLTISGYMTYVIKQLAMGEPVDTSIDNIVLQGVTRSGLLPLSYNYMFALSPFKSNTRYAQNNLSDMILGPGFGTAADMYKFFSGFTDVNQNWADHTKQAVALIPFNNIMFLNNGINSVIDANDKSPKGLKRLKQKQSKLREAEHPELKAIREQQAELQARINNGE